MMSRGLVSPTFIFCAIWLLAAAEHGQNERTELNHVRERVFSRQKRFVIFPLGSNLKFTGSIAKGLLSKFPKGVGLTLEQALYYPVPSKREEVYPKHLRQKTTPAPKPQATFVYIPGTNWRFKAHRLAKPKPVRLQQRIDAATSPAYVNPTKWAKWSKYEQQPWTPAPQYYEKYAQPWQPAAHSKWSKWTTESPKWANYGKRWYRAADEKQEPNEKHYDPDNAPYETISYADLEHVQDWRHYHGHRDRRSLFDQLGGFSRLFGFDTKACIMRAICDSRQLLLPSGYSMFHDIVRLIFTMPTITGVDDDYSRTMRLNAKDCSRQFRQQCQVDILALIFGGQWH